HQRLTVTVMTPEGPVSGESVMGVEFRDPPDSLAVIDNFTTDGYGEAVVVDLGDGRYLFALLHGSPDGLAGQLREAYRDIYDAHRASGYGRYIRKVKADGTVRVLPEHAYPMLVAFKDLSVPESVVEVPPDDLESVFGAGYALDNMTIEITRAPLTMGRVVSVLPWLPSRDKNLRPSDAKFSEDVLPVETIGRPSFIRNKP
ncbi:hypothetical protein, partial [uncultured Roseovarius sp.]|uniref:hypothetical protein n=1 Tax=uncultured Roseovarius sp. TaxID=293344 RepID=UPI0025EDDBD3